MRLKHLMFLVLILSMTGCVATYVTDKKGRNIKAERPEENSINYNIYYSIDSISYNIKGEEAAYIRQVADETTETQKKISKEIVQKKMRNSVDKVFNRNKLYLVDVFKKNTNDYYFDINLRIRRLKEDSILFVPFQLLSMVLPYPPLFDEWNFFLNIDVYESKPIGASKPIAMYEYTRNVRQRYSAFIAYFGFIPLSFFGNLGGFTGSDSPAKGLAEAMDDMLLEFTSDLKSGKRNNITRKSDIFSEID